MADLAGSGLASGLNGGTGLSKTSSVASIAGIAIPLLLSLFGSKKASPQAAAQTTAAQNAANLQALPPEIKNLLELQTQNAQAAQPLYLNALSAQNRLLPSWARGGSPPTTGPTGPTVPTPAPYVGGGVGESGGSGGAKTAFSSTSDIPLSGIGVDNGLVPGNSLDPETVMMLIGILTGQPSLGLMGKVLNKPPTAMSNTNFTLT